MKSLTESILDSDFDQSYDKAYEKLLKDLTKLRDDLVKFISQWQKLNKDGKGYSTDDWEISEDEWSELQTTIYLEFNKLIRKHHLDNLLTSWSDVNSYTDSIKIINKKSNRTSHISMIWVTYDRTVDDKYIEVWVEDPKYFLELLQKQ